MIEFLASELFKNAVMNLFMVVGVLAALLAAILLLVMIIYFIAIVMFTDIKHIGKDFNNGNKIRKNF